MCQPPGSIDARMFGAINDMLMDMLAAILPGETMNSAGSGKNKVLKRHKQLENIVDEKLIMSVTAPLTDYWQAVVPGTLYRKPLNAAAVR